MKSVLAEMGSSFYHQKMRDTHLKLYSVFFVELLTFIKDRTTVRWCLKNIGFLCPTDSAKILLLHCLQLYRGASAIQRNYGLFKYISSQLEYVDIFENFLTHIGKNFPSRWYRLAGEHWLVTYEDSTFYIPEVGEKIVKNLQRTVLQKQQYCVVLDPYEDGKQMLGKRQLRSVLFYF